MTFVTPTNDMRPDQIRIDRAGEKRGSGTGKGLLILAVIVVAVFLAVFLAGSGDSGPGPDEIDPTEQAQ